MKQKKIIYFVVILLIVLMLAFCYFFDWNQVNSYEMYNTSSLSYVSGTVISVESENLEKDEDVNRYYGTQELIVHIKEGSYKGQNLEITNFLSTTSNVLVEEGTKVIICVDDPENAEAYFTIYNYDRTIPFAVIIGIFVLGMLLVGGWKGVKAVLSLIFTLIIIMSFLVQGIYHGLNVIPLVILTLLVVIFLALCILNGAEKKTLLFATATMTGLLVAAVFCMVGQKLLRIDGFNFSEVESLLLISRSTELQVEHLLFAGVLISSLGAVMDVGVSIVSSLYEVKRANPLQGKKEIFMAGMNIGKDMIGTMSNTLILAFAGTSLTTMLLLIGFGYQATQLLNSNYLMLEVVRGISSTFAVVMTVPAASAISALFIELDDVL